MTEQMSKLRFNCYLLREPISNPADALQVKYRPGGKAGLSELQPRSGAPEGARAFMGSTEPKQPPWLKEMDAFFSLDQVSNTAHRLVVFLPVGERWFAVCFGYGSGCLSWESLDTNFGLRLAARVVDPSGLVEVRSRRLDATARNQSVSVTTGTDLDGLSVSLDGEFARKLIGSGFTTGDASTRFSAGDSIAFRAEVDLDELRRTLAGFLERVEADPHPEFAFVDALEPLRSSSKLVRQLERLAAAVLLGREVGSGDLELTPTTLQLAHPEDVTHETVDHYLVGRGDEQVRLDTPDIDALRPVLAHLNVRRGTSFLRDVKVMAIGSDGEAVSRLQPLRDWLVFEAAGAGRTFILTLGRWFRVSGAFVEHLDADLTALPVAEGLALPEWPVSMNEGSYNTHAAEGRTDLVLLDKRLAYVPSEGKFETCDLFHESGQLVHVKRYSSSATLSHLWLQGTVSAEALGDQEIKSVFLTLIEGASEAIVEAAREAPKRVTYAIGVPDERLLPIGLPFFSKVALRDQIRALKGRRVTAAIARIQIVGDGQETRDDE